MNHILLNSLYLSGSFLLKKSDSLHWSAGISLIFCPALFWVTIFETIYNVQSCIGKYIYWACNTLISSLISASLWCFNLWMLAPLGCVLLVEESLFTLSVLQILSGWTGVQKQVERSIDVEAGEEDRKYFIPSTLCIKRETDLLSNLPTRNNLEKRASLWLQMIFFFPPNTPQVCLCQFNYLAAPKQVGGSS